MLDAATGSLLGLVLPPLIRPDETTVELGCILPAHAFWNAAGLAWSLSPPAPVTTTAAPKRSLASATATTIATTTMTTSPPPPAINLHAITRIRVAGSWGTGVVLDRDQGLVLTCAHVVRGLGNNVNVAAPPLTPSATSTNPVPPPITVSFRHESTAGPQLEYTRQADILLCSSGSLDVALLRVRGSVPTSVMSADVSRASALEPGEEVFAVGHAIFDSVFVAGCPPTVCRGTLARVARAPVSASSTNAASTVDEPVLLQTSACVFRGHSGGMLCDAKGRFVGVLTSNAKHSDGSIIPEINFAVPLSAIHDLAVTYPRTPRPQQPALLARIAKRLDATDEAVRSLWALEPVDLPPPPSHHHSSSSASEVAGGSFASFLGKFRSSRL